MATVRFYYTASSTTIVVDTKSSTEAEVYRLGYKQYSIKPTKSDGRYVAKTLRKLGYLKEEANNIAARVIAAVVAHRNWDSENNF